MVVMLSVSINTKAINSHPCSIQPYVIKYVGEYGRLVVFAGGSNLHQLN
jgi:hypothetical protein